MEAVFYISAAVAVLATALVITRTNAVHALLYFLVSLFATALIFFVLGAPFAAALEVIIYAGAIVVFFVFVVMMLNLGPEAAERERALLRPGIWLGPAALALVLAGELGYVLLAPGPAPPLEGEPITPREVGRVLFGPYLLAVEMAAMLLLAGLVGAYHIGKRMQTEAEDRHGGRAPVSRSRAGRSAVPAGPDRRSRSS